MGAWDMKFSDMPTVAAYGDSSLDIKNATTGISKSGMKTYVSNVNVAVIDETIKKLRDTGGISDAVEAAWAGKSKEAFLKALDKSIQRIIEDLEKERDNLNAKFDNLEYSYLSQDEKLAQDIESQF